MKKQKDIEVTVKLEDCPHGGIVATDVEVREVESYVAEGSPSTVGWTRSYAAAWDATFSEKNAEPEAN